MSNNISPSLPLAGMTVVEISDGKTGMCGRYLADLGADVILVEPPGGAASRRAQPMLGESSLYFATHNANKRSVVLDFDADADRATLERLLDRTDIFIDSTAPGVLQAVGLGADHLRARNPSLVVLSISEFGLTGPYRDYLATNSVHMALGGVLCRSGLPGMEPVLPPGSLGYEGAAVQAAWCALLGYWQRLQTGLGDHLDFSIFEATAQVVDPGLGMAGSAAAGKSARDVALRGRPPRNPLYAIFACADGYVRICVLSARQWEGMSAWLGTAHEFTDPSYGNLSTRTAVIDRINLRIGELFRDQPARLLVAEGQRRGVPIAAVAAPADVLSDEHFLARGAFMPFELTPALKGMVPSGFVEINGERVGIRTGAPAPGAHNADVLRELAAAGQQATPGVGVASGGKAATRRPLEGIRVLDFGIIVAGAELGRVLADQGAEVIKVENRAFPDGSRQAAGGAPMSVSFAQGNRNKQSLGVNLKSEKGREQFKRLVAQSDVVLSNFKPGTLDALGLGYDVLKLVNPRIVMADSSALGRSGPQSRSLGYGPLVRASSGLTRLWCYPDIENSFSDGVTIYPDHFASRVAAVAVLALLIAREHSGVGASVSVSQAETFLTANSEHFLRESLQPGSFRAQGNVSEFSAPDGVFPCKGDDEWCAVSVRNDDDWVRLATAIGRTDLLADQSLATVEGRLARREQLGRCVGEWTGQQAPHDVTRILQAAGVPAGHMQRLGECEDDPHLQERQFFRTFVQTGLAAPLLTENGPVKALRIPDPEIRPAPFQGQHTRAIAARLLGLSSAEIDALIASGDLEEMLPAKA
jgi:crotonobetainyl-CoA:carnitine CoA-transferase CaiB-like acyl-CoA transferase